jgi:glycosyltransferase involved in cell wall biosynthesis
VESCLQDGCANAEVVVVDDGSMDNTVDLVRSFEGSVRLLQYRHTGANAARNLGLKYARGRYVRFLDDDDWLSPGVNTRQIETIENTGVDVCYGDWQDVFFEDGQIREGAIHTAGHVDDVVDALLSDWWCANSCYLIRRDLALAVGGWDEKLQACQDFDFMLRVAMHGARFVYSPNMVSYYLHHVGSSVSQDNLKNWALAKRLILSNAEKQLVRASAFSEKRRRLVGSGHWKLAKILLSQDRAAFNEAMGDVQRLLGREIPGPSWYRGLVRAIGYRSTENLLELRRRYLRRTKRNGY